MTHGKKSRRALAGWLIGAIFSVASAAPVRAIAATLDLTTATIMDVQSAFATGKVTSTQVTEAYLARIAAYDDNGPAINAVIMVNPNALAEAKARDAERAAGRLRGPLHGIPILVKDNYDTHDMPTTAGSQLLKGSIPAADAFVVKKLRDAGAVIVAKVNMNEFAGSGGMVNGARDPAVLRAGRAPAGFSSMGLQTHNPHDTARVPSSSSGGTGASVAAAYGQFGLGTDTGGSVRGPSSANGIVGLKTTMGLISRSGIVPLALSLDTAGPMARNVTDLAVALGAMAGVDPKDPMTKMGAGKAERDYTKFLKPGALKGVRIGVARDFMGADPGTDRVTADAINKLRELGAVIVDPVKFPEHLLAVRGPVYELLVNSEFKAQITDYLKTLKPGFPKTYDEIVALANDPATNYASPQKAYALKYSAARALSLDDPNYLALRNQMLPAFKAGVEAVFAAHKLDAIFYPTNSTPAALIEEAPRPPGADGPGSPSSLVNESWLPEIVVPAGMTYSGLPVTISFLGPAFSEAQLIGYAYDYEQATKAIRLPKLTPALASDVITY